MYGFKSFGSWQFLAFRVYEQQLIYTDMKWYEQHHNDPVQVFQVFQARESHLPQREISEDEFTKCSKMCHPRTESKSNATYRLSLDYQFPTVKSAIIKLCTNWSHNWIYITWIIISDHEWLNIKINSISIPGAFSATAPRALEVGVPANKGRPMAPRRWRSKWLPSSYH